MRLSLLALCLVILLANADVVAISHPSHADEGAVGHAVVDSAMLVPRIKLPDTHTISVDFVCPMETRGAVV